MADIFKEVVLASLSLLSILVRLMTSTSHHVLHNTHHGTRLIRLNMEFIMINEQLHIAFTIYTEVHQSF